MKQFLSSPRVSLLTVDEEAAERYGVIQRDLRVAGTPIPTNDIWISAVAMRDGLVVVTTDPHYAKVPHVVVELHEPFGRTASRRSRRETERKAILHGWPSLRSGHYSASGAAGSIQETLHA